MGAPRSVGVDLRLMGRSLTAAILAIIMAGTAAAQPADDYEPARRAIREAVASKTLQSVSVAVFRNGRIDWEESFGLADRERGVKATPRTAYSLASISKPFTATALMTLVQAGKIGLDKPANDYLGAAKLIARVGDVREATVRRIANHTSGLPFHVQFFYANAPYRRPAPEETIRKFGQIISRPGERFNYSNLGFGILGDVVADVSGESYSAYMTRAVFGPLDLQDTAVGLPTRKGVLVAPRYTPAGVLLPYYVTDHPGASEIYSSAHDLIRFAAFHLKTRLPEQRAILSAGAIDQMHLNTSRPGSEAGYGVGFDTARRNGYETVTHGGSMPGVATQMMLFPAKGLAIVVLSNTWSTPGVRKIADTIAAALLPGWSSGPRGATQPASFIMPTGLIGKWSGHIARPGEADLPVTLVARDGVIEASVGGGAPVRLENAAFADDRLTGTFATPLPAKDAERYANTIRLDVRLEGDRVYGGAAATDDLKSHVFVAGLTYWVDLIRVR